ncbi:MAG: hypothetical protein OEL20_13100 [Sulfuritalea sp.]|nr:hypothetical protein [Sulfuritalea sp.]
MKRVTFTARDGHPLAAYRFDPAGPVKGHVIIAAAMAVPQSFHAPFARHPANRGDTVWTFDFRALEPARHDLPHIGHFGFFKPQSETALRPLVTDWLDRAARLP